MLAALLAPAAVFLYLAAVTSDGSGRVERLTRWESGGALPADAGGGVTFPVGAYPVLLLHDKPDPGPVYSLLTFEVYLRNPLPAEAGFLYGRGRALDRFQVHDFSTQIGRTGWNPIAVTADDAAGMGNAPVVGLSFVSVAGPNVMGIRGAELRTVPFSRRLGQMVSALLRPELLSQRSMNFIPSQKIAGRGFLHLIWVALPLALIVLLFRRFVLRRPLRMAAHAAVTVLVLFVLADLRNSADLAANAEASASRRARLPDTMATLAEIEAGFPWFTDALRYLGAWGETHPDGSYYLHVAGSYFAPQAADRAAYYLLPLRRAATLNEADVALVYGHSFEPFEASVGWGYPDALPSGAAVYKRLDWTPR
ncbi:MAG: hypothetical protein Q8R92_01390 [Deltaproteobacteria bacterium]|nr:hypothetical protein [Deltaproteobacteria bacterium]